ncbi:Gfo/Idh/MocA family protein [Candidatus Poribacteria bacterium]
MAKKKDKLRVGVIGPGGAGSGRTAEFISRDDVQVVAAADTRDAAFDRMEERFKERIKGYKPGKIKRYAGEYEFTQMIDKEDLDIVGVFSPHSLHDVHAKYAMRNGAHVIVEKPMANFVGDAIAMHKISQGSGKHLLIHYQRHFASLYITGKRLIREGLIGDITKFEVFLAQRWGAGGWRGDPRFSGGGQPNDSGSHLQDIFLWMTGLLPQSVFGTTSMDFEDDNGKVIKKNVEIDSHSTVTMANGAKGKIDILGNTKIGFDEWVIMTGTEGTLSIKEGKLLFRAKGKRKEEELPLSRPEGYPRSNIDNLVGLIKGEYDTNFVSGLNGIRTSLLTNSIILSGKGPKKKNRISCDEILENEGYSMEYVKNLIAESEKNSMF